MANLTASLECRQLLTGEVVFLLSMAFFECR